MEYGESIQTKFDLIDAIDKFNRCKIDKIASGWDTQATNGLAIKDNALPLNKPKSMPDNWTGKYYKDNWVWKGIKWLVSMQSGSEIQIDIKSDTGMFKPKDEILELETNYAFSQFLAIDELENCLYDKYYTGFGVARAAWNTARITPTYMTGQPKFDYIDSRKVWFDPNTRKPDLSDMRYLFHEEWFDYKTLKQTYPEWSEFFSTELDSHRINASDIAKVVTMQYKQIAKVKKVFIEDTESGETRAFLYDEWIAETVKQAENPDALLRYQQEQSELSFEQWIVSGAWLPEGVIMKGTFTIEEDAVFQVIILDSLYKVLSQPQYVGQSFSYFFLPGIQQSTTAYPFGLAYYMSDMLEISIAMMTVLMVQTVKYQRNEKTIQQGALANEAKYIKDGHKIGVDPIVKEGWQEAHPGVKAVDHVDLPQFPQGILVLNDMITNAQKTLSGAVDAAIGLASYSGQSGVQVAQLQAASRVYHREDLDKWRRFIRDCVTWLKDSIVQYRNYPHQIMGLDETDKKAMLDVGTTTYNGLSNDSNYVEITIQENEEVARQIEQERAMMLFDRGLYTPFQTHEKIGTANPEKVVEQLDEWNGVKQNMELIKQYPELQNMINQYVQQAQTQDKNAV